MKYQLSLDELNKRIKKLKVRWLKGGFFNESDWNLLREGVQRDCEELKSKLNA